MPNSPLFIDNAGALYGTTSEGGSFGAGTVFLIDSAGTETLLSSFGPSSDYEGQTPFAGPTMDKSGKLYGTTYAGGSAQSSGTVYEITEPDELQTFLYDFGQSPTDGSHPVAGVILDAQGNLYGTTLLGGKESCSCGTVFRLAIRSGEVVETILHSFSGAPDGSEPYAALLLTKGVIFGTTAGGGSTTACAGGCGTVFSLTSEGDEKVTYSFAGGDDGREPKGGLITDPEGNFYGTTVLGGAFGYGTVFKIAPLGKETVLYSFTGGSDGAHPFGALVRDGHGNLFGVTNEGGSHSCECGTVFELMADGTEKTRHVFGAGTDGQFPTGGLIMDKSEDLYGTTSLGGTFGNGTVFKLAP